MRNEVNSRIRSETRKFNNDRIEKAGNDNEMWQVANDVIKPRKGSEWRRNIDDVITEDEEKIANSFNNHFINKVEKLKEGINKNNIENPLQKLKVNLEGRSLKFSLKKINKSTLLKSIKKIKKKKSVGTDGMSQEQMVMGTKSLADPLLNILTLSKCTISEMHLLITLCIVSSNTAVARKCNTSLVSS